MKNAPPSKQIFCLLQDFQAFSYYAFNRIHSREASNIPFISWPDGTPCPLANLFMLELLNRPGRTGLGLSRRGQKGGSIGEYASKISHLIKFCYKSQRDLYQINDGIFSAFISSL
ncbi:hypothetical protein ACQKEF_23270 [Pseudomonas oryzihabitans]|uniref:hypothetical protein n=1 Tax=Pseudomonas oryzihabitans TaxID=47885 RepID=UPI003D0844E2